MKNMGNKGFTLIELIATIVVLALVMGIASYSITSLINKSHEKDYELLVSEIKNAVELYYQECRYSNNDAIYCPSANANGSYEIALGDLLKYGFLKSNGQDGERLMILNPRDGVDISSCIIIYRYGDGDLSLDYDTTISDSCPDVSQ